MTINSGNEPNGINGLSVRIERNAERTTSERLERNTDRTTSGRTERTDRTIILPEYTPNGRRVNYSSQQERFENGSAIDTEDEFTVPILPMGLAIFCGVLNFVLPGFGTMLAGIFAPCCARSEFGVKDYSCLSACVIIGVGFLQLLLTTCFLIGWVWSAIWGIALIGTASDFSNYTSNPESSYWRNRPTSNRSRRSLRPRSNLIYPVRAPSNISYTSPPPPYQMFGTPPPRYSSRLSDRTDRNTSSTPINVSRTNRVPSARTMTTTTQIMEDSSEFTAWDCPQCSRSYEADIRRHLCQRCSREVCLRCYTRQVRTRNNERITVCNRCYVEVSQDPRVARV